MADHPTPRDGDVLLVEDAPSLAHLYAALLRRAGHAVDVAGTAAEAEESHQRRRYGVVLMDLMLPDGDGLEVLGRMRRRDPDLAAIVITANGSINRAVEAIRAGARDFLVKPLDETRLLRAVAAARASAQGGPGGAGISREDGLGGLIGSSPGIEEIRSMIREVARSSATVFVTGESGTGKEVCAHALHALSNRRAGPFVALNCGAIPRDLLESEVFGHLKGSFTGAIADKVGAAAAASGGTLFLDEICEMDVELQTKMLRFLQSSTIQPVGATAARKVDVRIVCATNRDPEAEVAAGRFRSDLFYRLYVVPIHLPPLRERGEDVIEIAEALLAQFAREEGRRLKGFDPAARAALLRYSWPGNVRELQNVLRNIAVLRDGELVTAEMLPERMRRGPARPRAAAAAPMAADYESAIAALVGHRLDDVERDLIEATIAACDGSVPRAARQLDVSPSTLYRRRGTARAG
ncbi:MAG: sigma-54-dependent transcriptional regulator [Rubrimonas sp.]